MRVLFHGFSISCLLSFSALAVDITQSGQSVIISNGQTEVAYDLSLGVYSAVSHINSVDAFDKAYTRVDDAFSTNPGYVRTWESLRAKGPWSKGKKLRITCAAKDMISIHLDISLFEGRGAIMLGAGITNTTGEPIQANEIRPMEGARFFSSLPGKTDIRILTGQGGAGETAVLNDAAVDSSNNLMATFISGGERHSMVAGGLTYHEFAKYVGIGDDPREGARRRDLQRQAPPGCKLISYLNCGLKRASEGRDPTITVQRGESWRFDDQAHAAPSACSWAVWDPEFVAISVRRLDPKKRYLVGFSWWDYDATGRRQSVSMGRNDGSTSFPIAQGLTLPNYTHDKAQPEQRAYPVPADLAALGRFRLTLANEQPSPANAVVSEVWVWECEQPESDIAWGPAPVQQQEDQPPSDSIEQVSLLAYDPVGKRVDPGRTYLPERDTFYVDFTEPDPFEAIEAYGFALREANNAAPNPYTFPTVCGWYVSMPMYGGGPAINNTAGMVWEVEQAARSGFLRYAPVAVRLVPDTYTDDNEQGWWDDAHWRMYGHYLPPYETSKKYGAGVTSRGGIAETYLQTGFISMDYAKSHPEHMLFNTADMAAGAAGNRNTAPCSFDYTDPDFQRHVRKAWANLKAGGIRGVMFDYPNTGWRESGGFEDTYATTASAYRKIFELAKQGLGPDSYIHERIVNSQPLVDMTIGVVDSQRVWADTDIASPAMYTRCGLRWYKNRVVYSYDTDSKNLFKTAPDNRDGLRQMLTMIYVVSGRLLLANSFSKMTREQLRDLSRVFPMHTSPRSARPLDAFTSQPFPKVYDFKVTPQWHQLTFYNPDNNVESAVGVSLGDACAKGGMGLDPAANYHVYDFWNDAYVGLFAGSSRLEQVLRPGEARMLSVRQALDVPQVISVNRHVMQGYLDLRDERWNTRNACLSGIADVIAGDPYEIIIAANGWKPARFETDDGRSWLDPAPLQPGVWRLTLYQDTNKKVTWKVFFKRVD